MQYKYISVKIDKPIEEVKQAICSSLSVACYSTEVISNRIICRIPKKILSTSQKDYSIAIYLKTHQDSTAVFFLLLTDDDNNFERDVKQILQNVEYILKVFHHFSNLTLDYFTDDSEEEIIEKKDDKIIIPSSKRFDEIVEKLTSLKELLNQGIITELEYKEKSEPLIEEL